MSDDREAARRDLVQRFADRDAARERTIQELADELSAERAKWIEGVTPTWAECNHGVRVLEGTYLRDLVPTGQHPECLRALEQEMAEQEASMYDDALRLLY